MVGHAGFPVMPRKYVIIPIPIPLPLPRPMTLNFVFVFIRYRSKEKQEIGKLPVQAWLRINLKPELAQISKESSHLCALIESET